MNRANAKALLPIIQAYTEGKQIQLRLRGSAGWVDLDNPTFGEDASNYRIKPEVVRYRRMLVKDYDGVVRIVTCYPEEEARNGVAGGQLFVRWIDVEWQEVEV